MCRMGYLYTCEETGRKDDERRGEEQWGWAVGVGGGWSSGGWAEVGCVQARELLKAKQRVAAFECETRPCMIRSL